MASLVEKYPKIPWLRIVASERSFTDYSFLLGSSGHRKEHQPYIEALVSRIVTFFEEHYKAFQPDGVITSYGDNIFNLIAGVLAQQFGIRIFIPHPAFITGSEQLTGGFIGNDIHLQSFKMLKRYRELLGRKLADEEFQKGEQIRAAICNYNSKDTLELVYGRKNYEKPVSPQAKKGLIQYILKNKNYNKDIAFFKILIWEKIKANLVRVSRSVTSARAIKAASNGSLPEKFVYFPMHYQPEASTLVAGVYYSNQVALIENISKLLPLGYKLVVREHPRGRSFRPSWHYRHLSQLHNVQFSDLNSKRLIQASEFVITISGTSAIEACAFGKPVAILGETFHSYNLLYYNVRDLRHLENIMRSVLVEKKFLNRLDRREMEIKFLLSYSSGVFNYFPLDGNEKRLAKEIINDFLEGRDLKFSPRSL